VIFGGCVLSMTCTASSPFEETKQVLAKKEASEKAKDKKDAVEKNKLEKDDDAEILGSDEDDDKFFVNIGDKVRTIAAKQKDKFNNMVAEIITIKKKAYRVKILEGPAMGTMKDFLFRNLKAMDKEVVPGVTPAGDDPAEVEAKRQKLAASLFGTMLD
jgi:hypothetical protein